MTWYYLAPLDRWCRFLAAGWRLALKGGMVAQPIDGPMGIYSTLVWRDDWAAR